jgi:hypothetical protein
VVKMWNCIVDSLSHLPKDEQVEVTFHTLNAFSYTTLNSWKNLDRVHQLADLTCLFSSPMPFSINRYGSYAVIRSNTDAYPSLSVQLVHLTEEIPTSQAEAKL